LSISVKEVILVQGLIKVIFGILLLGVGAAATKEGWKEISKGLK